MVITWKNVGGPDFSASNRLMQAGANLLNKSLSKGVGVVTQLGKEQEQLATAEAMAKIKGTGLDDIAALEAGGVDAIDAQGRGNRAKLLAAITGREVGARKESIADTAFQDTQDAQANIQTMIGYKQAQANNDLEGMQRFEAQLRGKGRGQTITSTDAMQDLQNINTLSDTLSDTGTRADFEAQGAKLNLTRQQVETANLQGESRINDPLAQAFKTHQASGNIDGMAESLSGMVGNNLGAYEAALQQAGGAKRSDKLLGFFDRYRTENTGKEGFKEGPTKARKEAYIKEATSGSFKKTRAEAEQEYNNARQIDDAQFTVDGLYRPDMEREFAVKTNEYDAITSKLKTEASILNKYSPTNVGISQDEENDVQASLFKEADKLSTDDGSNVKAVMQDYLQNGVTVEGVHYNVRPSQLRYAMSVAATNDDNWLIGLGNREVRIDALKDAVNQTLQGGVDAEAISARAIALQQKISDRAGARANTLIIEKDNIRRRTLQTTGGTALTPASAAREIVEGARGNQSGSTTETPAADSPDKATGAGPTSAQGILKDLIIKNQGGLFEGGMSDTGISNLVNKTLSRIGATRGGNREKYSEARQKLMALGRAMNKEAAADFSAAKRAKANAGIKKAGKALDDVLSSFGGTN